MRIMIMLLFLCYAGTCFAEDPLESLNTVEDTVATMEQTLEAQAVQQRDSETMASDSDHADRALQQLSPSSSMSPAPL